MTRVTNLNRVRKDRARAGKRAKADANAAKFGRTKAQKALDMARAEKARRALDGHERDGSGRDGSEPDGPERGGPDPDGPDPDGTRRE